MQGDLVGGGFIGKVVSGEQNLVTGDLLSKIDEKMRVLDEYGTCQMRTVQAVILQTFMLVVRTIAQAHLHGEQGRGDTSDLTALVDKTDQGLVGKIRRENGIGCGAGLVLFGDGEVKQPQTLMYGAGGIGDGLTEHLKGVAGHQDRDVAVDLFPQSILISLHIVHHDMAVAFGAGTDIDKVIATEGDFIRKGAFIHRAVNTVMAEDTKQCRYVSVVSVQIHDVVVKVQQLHALEPPLTRCRNLPLSEKQVMV